MLKTANASNAPTRLATQKEQGTKNEKEWLCNKKESGFNLLFIAVSDTDDTIRDILHRGEYQFLRDLMGYIEMLLDMIYGSIQR